MVCGARPDNDLGYQFIQVEINIHTVAFRSEVLIQSAAPFLFMLLDAQQRGNASSELAFHLATPDPEVLPY